MRRFIIAAIAWLACLPALATAQTPQVHWTHYDYQITVAKNGDLQFTESQQLAVDAGQVRKGSLHFDTGSYGRVRQIQVAEDGQPYRRDTSQAAGTYNGEDNGTRAQIDYFFRDPNATRHSITISYIVGQAIRTGQGQPALQLKLFCQGTTCPATDAATAQINFIAPVDAATLHPQTTGFSVEQSVVGQGIKLTGTAPLAGQSLTVSLALPPNAIPDANLSNQLPSSQNNPGNQPPSSIAVQPVAPRNLTVSPVLCVLVIFFLFVVFSVIRSSARTRRSTPYGGPVLGGGMLGGYPPRRRRWGGFFPWGGYGGWNGGWGGGYGAPPPFNNPPYDPGQPAQPDSTGGGQSWSDSGGGGQSWSDSSGGGQSWSDSGGGGQSWSDSGGSSGGDSGGSFGGDNGSSFS